MSRLRTIFHIQHVGEIASNIECDHRRRIYPQRCKNMNLLNTVCCTSKYRKIFIRSENECFRLFRIESVNFISAITIQT